MGWIDMRVVSPTHNPGNHGPWFVWSNNGYWFIVNKNNGRTKRIGRVGGKRINYFDRAIDTAYERNEKEQHKMRIKIDVSIVDDENMEQTLLDVADQVGYAVKSGQIMGNLYDHKEMNFVGTFEATEA